MNRSYKFGIVLVLFLVAFLTYLEAIEPEPLNWNPSYSSNDKIPLGAYVLYDNLKDNFAETVKVSKTPFDFLTTYKPEGVYMLINSHLQFDDAELGKLLTWVEEGNTLFLASDAFSKNLLDTLGLNVSTLVPDEGISSRPMLNLVQPELRNDKAYLFDKEVYHSIFSEIDTLDHTVLGISELYSEDLEIEDPEVNFVIVDHGKGQILLNTTPQAFTNFFILYEDNFEYVERALAYLPADATLYWDEYKKAGKTFQTSPLYILLSNKALKWAYYFTLLGALLFVLFEGKRKQRAIPVKEPLQNQTYHFTRTVAGLYLDRKDYKKVAVKKIALFLEYVRLHFRIPTASIDEELYRSLALNSGKDLEEVRKLFQLIQNLESKNSITKEDLLALNTAIASIKHK